jgi:glucose-6-phosphate 1-dehydrogenase
MVQNHLFQLLTLTAMEVPTAMNGEAVRNEKIKVLRSVRPMTPPAVAQQTVRGQYAASENMPAYREEEGVAPQSDVETFVAMKLFIDNWRWAGVPFYLRTGKRMSDKACHISLVFKREPLNLFMSEGCDLRGLNRLRLRIQPDEGVEIRCDAKKPGMDNMLRPVKLELDYDTAFESDTPEAYEHLLLDAIEGEPTLFIRDDEVEAAWRIIDSIRNAWQVNRKPPLTFYPAGSDGPAEADTLFNDPYLRWQPL